MECFNARFFVMDCQFSKFMRKSVVIMKKTELRDQLYGQITYLDLLVGEKRTRRTSVAFRDSRRD